MNRLIDTPQPLPRETYRFLGRALPLLRWATLAVLLLLTLMRPAPSHGGVPNWVLVLCFVGYNLLVDLLRHQFSRLRSFAWVALIDLPVAGLLYLLSTESGGPLFVLFFLAVDSAAASLTLRGTLIYTTAAAALATFVEVMLPFWSSSPRDIRQLVARLVMLALVGAGMAILTHRLALEQAAVNHAHAETARAAALDHLRADFIATVSHDLRTPLTAARAGLGMLETSGRDRLRPDEQALLGNVRRNTEYLGVLIDDLLAFNELEAGALHLERVPFDLRAMVMDATAAVGTLLKEKGQTLEVHLPDVLPVEGDPRRLAQVVVNLLANAHRHTPAGTHITVTGEAKAHAVLLMVRDNGPGIPEAEREAIFRRFYRGTSPLVAAQGGSGLGLAIARGIVELHGGRMWVASEAGGGATFFFSLPCAGEGAE